MTSEAEAEIRRRIASSGAISFAEFMEVSLYHPAGGYYSSPRQDNLADYFTSPSVHPAFGVLLCVQLHQMWQILGQPDPFWVIEAGAGNRTLARDILRAASQIGADFATNMRYVAVERGSRPQIESDASQSISPVISDSFPFARLDGCILSNELFDAMPVHRIRYRAGKLKSVYVSVAENGEFVEDHRDDMPETCRSRIQPYVQAWPDGYQTEVNIEAERWIREAATALRRGFVITIDYGYRRDNLYSPQRKIGTFETFYRHTTGGSPYQRVGWQDMTAHVDFTTLVEAGSENGLNRVLCETQADYLARLGIDDYLSRSSEAIGTDSDRVSNKVGMLELIKPKGLGAFRVLVQEKSTGVTAAGITPSESIVQGLKVPTRPGQGIDLVHDSYPSIAWELDARWPSDATGDIQKP